MKKRIFEVDILDYKSIIAKSNELDGHYFSLEKNGKCVWQYNIQNIEELAGKTFFINENEELLDERLQTHRWNLTIHDDLIKGDKREIIQEKDENDPLVEYICKKHTIWQNQFLTRPMKLSKVKKLIEEGALYDHLDYFDDLYDTMESVDLIDNNGEATMKFYTEKNEVIATNVDKENEDENI
jgi:hypothetical protein